MKEKYNNGELAWSIGHFSCVKESSGELNVLEFQKELDFVIKRVFFLRNIESGAQRGFHSHRELKQVILCLSGSFVISLDTGINKTELPMTSDDSYLLLDGKVWREMHSFTDDCIMLVLCDREYYLDEVVRDYEKFKDILAATNDDYV